ncbi:MAG: SDR family NAD(P)-dependent oxidoreductase [Vicinamibacterales bacterium]
MAGKTVLIAGASRGIGLAAAHAFRAEGAHVVITARSRASLDAAEGALGEVPGGGTLVSTAADMTDPDAVDRVVADTTERFGGIDIAVANVGSGAGSRGWQAGEQEWLDMLRVNLLGGIAVARAVMPHLATRNGALVFVASIAGRETIEAPVSYIAAKASLLAAAKALARNCPPGVRVNAVAPGNVLHPDGVWARKLSQDRAGVERYIDAEVPLRRLGRPEEVADAIVFLASARAAFIHGACLVVDGGQTRSM